MLCLQVAPIGVVANPEPTEAVVQLVDQGVVGDAGAARGDDLIAQTELVVAGKQRPSGINPYLKRHIKVVVAWSECP